MTASEAPAKARCFAGIDPSLTGTGICVLMEGERPFVRTIATSPKTHPVIFERLNYIASEIIDVLVERYGFGPDDGIFIERPFVSPQHMNSQQNLLVLSYLIRHELYSANLPWHDVSPMTLKKFVCGKGTAEKSMMLMRVYQHWDISADDDNQADAVGLAHMALATAEVRGKPAAIQKWARYQIEAIKTMLAKG
jgi:Holliday junction resolvasome RuvABC endonuclease subunit